MSSKLGIRDDDDVVVAVDVVVSAPALMHSFFNKFSGCLHGNLEPPPAVAPPDAHIFDLRNALPPVSLPLKNSASQVQSFLFDYSESIDEAEDLLQDDDLLGSSDSQYPVSRKARKYMEKRNASFELQRAKRLQSFKKCKYLDSASKHPSDLSTEYSSEDEGELTPGFIDDTPYSDQENIDPNGEASEFMKTCLPLFAERELQKSQK